MREKVSQIPLNGGLWYPGGDMTTNRIEFHLRVYLTQILPALLIDGLCIILGRKPL
jgi:alcohol-forming fatty acyl-CoA reductase